MKLLFRIAAAVAAFSAAGQANAATIINASGVTVQALGASANLNNNSLAGVVYLFNEGTKNGFTSFLLHYDRQLFDPKISTGAFDISLSAGETFGSLITSSSGLNLSDPSTTATYSSSAVRGLEDGSAIFFGDDVNVGMASPIHVTFNLSTAISSLDEARILIKSAPAVPEPATWAMMLVGFGAIGGVTRYRRRKTNVAFA